MIQPVMLGWAGASELALNLEMSGNSWLFFLASNVAWTHILLKIATSNARNSAS